MANVFLDLPLPAGNGVGASVDTSSLGSNKTFQVAGAYNCIVTIEGSNDGGATWVPLASFSPNAAKRTLDCAVQFMRVRIASFISLPDSCGVSSNDDGGSFANLAALAGDGTAAPTDVSALGTLNTVIVAGSFTGTVVVEISDDGTDYVECMTFSGPGFRTKRFTAQFMRVTRRNVTPGNVGLPVVNVGAIADASGGGGGGGGLTPTFVYRPGGVAADNVYTDWNALYAALNAQEGARVLQFDDSLAAVTIPAGTWNMQDVRWFGVPAVGLGDRLVVVNITEGATFPALRWITGLDIANNATATVPVTQGGLDELSYFRIDGGTQLGVGAGDRGAGTVPFIECTAGGVLSLKVYENSILGWTDNGPNIRCSGLSLSIILCDGSQLWPGGVAVDVTAGNVFLVVDHASRIPEGTITGSFQVTDSQIEELRYNPDKSLSTTTPRDAELGRIHRQDTTLAPHTLNLPVVTEHSFGRYVGAINEVGANTLTIVPQAGDTLNGVVDGTVVLAAGESILLTVAASGVWTTVASKPGGGGGGVQSVELIESVTPGSSFPTSGADYTPLAPGGAAPAIEWQYGAPGNFAIDFLYSMSAANAGDVDLRLDRLVIGDGDNPDAALVAGTVTTFTPGNDTNAHLVQNANFEITASAGDEVRFSLNRPAGDTHPGDFRLLGIRVRAL